MSDKWQVTSDKSSGFGTSLVTGHSSLTMSPAASRLALSALLAVLAGVLYFALRRDSTKPLAVSQTSESQPGYRLAQIYCQGCHLFPEPALLSQSAWEQGALPLMAPWLGLAKPDLEKRRRDGEILSEANVFPPSPLLSLQDWQAIQNYYKGTAPKEALPQMERPQIRSSLAQFKVKRLAYRRDVPMTTLVKIEQGRLYVGDAMTRTLEALNPAGERQFAVEFDSAPISLRAREGALDLTLVGRLFPSDDIKGKLLTLRPEPNDMNIAKVLGQLRRPTDTTFADLNGDGREDFIVCQFGHRLGRLSWFENLGAGKHEEHLLSERPGAIRSQAHDTNDDGLPDIFVVMGQAREGIYLFVNRGQGRFEETTIVEQHPAFGYAWLELADFNRDGHIDLLTANGDNGEFVSPPKNYHGVRIYLNDGQNKFSEKWFFPLNGAYKAVADDFDRDGDLDIAAISYFPDYQKSPEESFVYLENRGGWTFDAFSFPECTLGRWITMDAGDLDGDGDSDIVLGSLILGPTTVPIPDSVQAGWKTNGPAILMLENLQVKAGNDGVGVVE